MGAAGVEATLLAGAPELLRLHARELPQRDDLCGAFCASLALRAAGLGADGDVLDQDAVALAAGSVIAANPDPGILPAGESGRSDYRVKLPTVADEALSGTTVEGVVRAIGELSAGSVGAIALSGPWTEQTLAGAFDVAADLQRPVALLANHATRHLWGASPSMPQLLAFLLEGRDEGPPADWDVGHFACVVARVRGIGGSMYVLADTYPSLGVGGVHAQPSPRLAAALARPAGPEGGVIVVAHAADVPTVREGARRAGLTEGIWDNGTVLAANTR